VPLFYENRTPELHLVNPDLNEDICNLITRAALSEERRLESAFLLCAGLNDCGGCGLAASINRPTTMLAAWTSSANLICWCCGLGGVEASLATCSPQA
jgi:hypothetical protein